MISIKQNSGEFYVNKKDEIWSEIINKPTSYVTYFMYQDRQFKYMMCGEKVNIVFYNRLGAPEPYYWILDRKNVTGLTNRTIKWGKL